MAGLDRWELCHRQQQEQSLEAVERITEDVFGYNALQR